MKTKIQEAIALVKQTNDLLNDVAGILSAVENPNKEIENMEELYATGDYDCYAMFADSDPIWELVKIPSFRISPDVAYRLIHKKHTHIARVVANNPDIKLQIHDPIEQEDTSWLGYDFFENYCEDFHYNLTKPSGELDGLRFNTTQDNKDEIEEFVRSHGYTITDSYKRFEENGYAWICIVVYEVSDNINDELFACYSFKDSPNYRKTTEAFICNGQLVDELPSEEHKEVCRWKNRHDEFNKEYSWSYCPYCGKKIEA